MKHPILTLAFCLALGLLAQSAAPTHAAQPAEAYADFTADGGWCWFSNPRALSRDGKTYSGWVTEDGSVQAAEVEHATGRVTTVTLHPQYERDDHDNPAFVFLPDGRLMAFYSKHGGGKNPAIHSRTTSKPGVFADWDPEVEVALRDDSVRNAGISYCNPHLLSAENNTLYLFWRGYSFKPTMAKSTDFGKTWTPAQVVFSVEGLPKGNRPYGIYASNGKDRIHMIFTDGHPRNEKTNSVYYVCYRDGAFFKADGTRICGVNELPIRPEQADLVYDAKNTGVRAWIFDLAFDENDRPIIAYTRLPEETDHRYHYARWDGQKWLDNELCAAGKWFPQTEPGKKEKEPHYSSGLALDYNDPSVVYLSRPVNGVREIERWTTGDGGKSWKSEAVTAGSKFDNVRPFVVQNHETDGPTVLWMNLHGRYVHYTNYLTAIKMDRPAKTIGAPAPTPVPSGPPLSGALEPKAILTAMERVADWQLAHPAEQVPTAWHQGVGYTGMMALADISKQPKYLEAMIQMGQANKWKLGKRMYHADDHVVGQTYAELYLTKRDPKMLEPMRVQFDEILAKPPDASTLDFTKEEAKDLWSWCDALFMGPPAWIRLWSATGNEKYLDYAITNWWRTSDYLYDPDEHLYYRDSIFFDRRQPNGKKVFWARGNGWVMGGLVRMLQYLPKDHPERDRFVAQFKEMAAKLLALQQPDGLWRAGLLDPESFPDKETSGSGLFAYALAFGINEGILDRATYEPAVRKAWEGLVGCVAPDGKLLHVQPKAAGPGRFPADSTEVYGVGAFLLAGSEVYRLAGGATAQ